MHENAILEFRQLTKDWFDKQKAGRLVGIDILVDKFKEADHEGEDEILREMCKVVQGRNDQEKETKDAVEYYFTLMEGCVHRGWGFVEAEQERLQSGITKVQLQPLELLNPQFLKSLNQSPRT